MSYKKIRKLANRYIEVADPDFAGNAPAVNSDRVHGRDFSGYRLVGNFRDEDFSFCHFYKTDFRRASIHGATKSLNTRTELEAIYNPGHNPKKINFTFTNADSKTLKVVGVAIDNATGLLTVDLSPEELEKQLVHMSHNEGKSSLTVGEGQIHAVEVLVPLASRALKNGIIIPSKKQQRGILAESHPLYGTAQRWNELKKDDAPPVQKNLAKPPEKPRQLSEPEARLLAVIDAERDPIKKVQIAAENINSLPVSHPLFDGAFQVAEDLLVAKIEAAESHEDKMALAVRGLRMHLLPCNHALYDDALWASSQPLKRGHAAAGPSPEA